MRDLVWRVPPAPAELDRPSPLIGTRSSAFLEDKSNCVGLSAAKSHTMGISVSFLHGPRGRTRLARVVVTRDHPADVQKARVSWCEVYSADEGISLAKVGEHPDCC